MTDKQRTNQQNKSLHVFFTQLSEQLNDAGLDMRRTLKPEISIPWTPKTIKEYLWRPIQQAQLEKKSTTELTTKEIDKVFETLTRHLGERFGVECEFPSLDSLMWKQRVKE